MIHELNNYIYTIIFNNIKLDEQKKMGLNICHLFILFYSIFSLFHQVTRVTNMKTNFVVDD